MQGCRTVRGVPCIAAHPTLSASLPKNAASGKTLRNAHSTGSDFIGQTAMGFLLVLQNATVYKMPLGAIK